MQETEPHKAVLLTFGTSSVFNVKNLIAVPIQGESEEHATKESPVGCIELVNKKEGAFSDLDSALLAEVGKELTSAIANEALHKQRVCVENAKSKQGGALTPCA